MKFALTVGIVLSLIGTAFAEDNSLRGMRADEIEWIEGGYKGPMPESLRKLGFRDSIWHLSKEDQELLFWAKAEKAKQKRSASDCDCITCQEIRRRAMTLTGFYDKEFKTFIVKGESKSLSDFDKLFCEARSKNWESDEWFVKRRADRIANIFEDTYAKRQIRYPAEIGFTETKYLQEAIDKWPGKFHMDQKFLHGHE